VKAARAVVSTTPGLADKLAQDWQSAAQFYARFRVTEAMFRRGVTAILSDDSHVFDEMPRQVEDILPVSNKDHVASP